MAHALELGVVAEGVETEEQAAELRRLGCGQAQGWHFGYPVPATELVLPAQADRRGLTVTARAGASPHSCSRR